MKRQISCVIQLSFFLMIMLYQIHSEAQTNQFRGVNWADKRDNFQPGIIYISGLSSSDTYQSASIVADKVLSQFVGLLGSNSVRMPINEATVSSNYWNAYKGAIDVALTKGKVILCFWSSASGAQIKDMNAFWSTWQTVVTQYGNNPNMYFEVFNEPSQLNKTDLRTLYYNWLQRYPSFPQNRVILDGSGLAMNVSDIGSDSRFDKCLLAVHEYSFFGSTSSVKESDWQNHIKGFVGNYANRTVCTEWGGPMAPGTKNNVYYDKMDYNKPASNFFEAYLRGVSNQLREWKMGSFYWIGLRDNDWYSLTARTGEGPNIKLTVNNQSGLDRVKYSWGNYTQAPVVAITQPTTTTFLAPATIPITATASVTGGTISKVEFYNGTIKLGEDLTAPYSYTWTNVANGSYSITVVATDNLGNKTTSSPVIIKVNVPQAAVVAITQPTTTFLAPATIPITATASVTGGTISNVEFYNGTTKLGEDLTSPYSYTWTNVANGSYSITVVATDNLGNKTTSSPVNITVNVPQSPFNGTAPSIPGKIEAENYDLGGEGVSYHEANTNGNQGKATLRNDEVDIEATEDIGGGYNIAYILKGEWLEYTVDAASGGVYNLDLRLASDGDGKLVHIDADGVNVSGAVNVPNTGGWQTWQTITINNISLTQGQHVIRLAFDSDYMNLNYVEFRDAITTGLTYEKFEEIQLYPNPFGNEGLVIKVDEPIKYTITSIDGKEIERGTCSDCTRIGSNLTSGMYLINIEKKDRLIIQKIIKK